MSFFRYFDCQAEKGAGKNTCTYIGYYLLCLCNVICRAQCAVHVDIWWCTRRVVYTWRCTTNADSTNMNKFHKTKKTSGFM